MTVEAVPNGTASFLCIKIRKIYFKIQLQINTKCDSIEQDEKREKEGEKSARNRAKT